MSYADTFEPADPNEYVRPVALGVTLLLILWNGVGWFVDKGLTFEGCFIALMTGAFSLLSFNASAQMRRASSKVQTKSVMRAHRFWFGVLLMCSAWSGYSADHAFVSIVATHLQFTWSLDSIGSIITTAPALVILLMAAFVEPFLPWAIETVESAAKAPQARAEAIAEAVPRSSPRDAAKAVAKELTRQPPRNASKTRGGAAEERVVTRAPPLSEQDLKQAVDELTRQGEVVSIRRVAKHLDIPPSRVERSPAKHLLRAVA